MEQNLHTDTVYNKVRRYWDTKTFKGDLEEYKTHAEKLFNVGTNMTRTDEGIFNEESITNINKYIEEMIVVTKKVDCSWLFNTHDDSGLEQLSTVCQEIKEWLHFNTVHIDNTSSLKKYHKDTENRFQLFQAEFNAVHQVYLKIISIDGTAPMPTRKDETDGMDPLEHAISEMSVVGEFLDAALRNTVRCKKKWDVSKEDISKHDKVLGNHLNDLFGRLGNEIGIRPTASAPPLPGGEPPSAPPLPDTDSPSAPPLSKICQTCYKNVKLNQK